MLFRTNVLISIMVILLKFTSRPMGRDNEKRTRIRPLGILQRHKIIMRMRAVFVEGQSGCLVIMRSVHSRWIHSLVRFAVARSAVTKLALIRFAPKN